MNQRHTLALTAGAATLLAALPMGTIFVSFTWFLYAALAVAAVVGAAVLVRSIRGPVWTQVIAMLGGLLLLLTISFPSGGEFARFIPTKATFLHFNDLLVAAGEHIRSEATPVPDRPGLLLLMTIGIGIVALLVDILAVGLRRPALAGLPMLALYSVPVAVIPEGLSVLPFIFAAAGYIWLLISDSVDRVRRFGRRFTGEGRGVDVWEASPLSSAGRRLGVIGVVVAILIPLAVPGITSGLIDRLDSAGDGVGPGSGPGTGSRVDLTGFLSGQLLRDETTTMVRVKTTDPAPFYLRIGIADQPTERGFETRGIAGNPISELPDDYIVPAVPGVSSARYRAEVEVVGLNMNLAPIYQQVVGIEGLGSAWFFEPSSDQIFSRRESVRNRKYTVDFVRVQYSPDALRSAGVIAGTDPVRALAVVPPNEYVRDLVAELTDGKATEYDRVRAIYDHFTKPDSGFSYTLTTVEADTGSDIEDFLTAKKGFCVQYAAAMAWLVRAAGFPARVAFGFTRGSASSNGSYSLTNYNLHAWTEVYFPTFGWVPFDATPVGSVTGSVRSAWAPDPSTAGPGPSLDPDDLLPNDGGPSATPSNGPVDDPTGNDPGAGAPPINTWWLVGAAGGALVLALLFVPAMRRRSLSRRRRTRSGQLILVGADGARSAATRDDYLVDPEGAEAARRDAHEAWSELRDTMIDYRVDVDDAETPRATADRLNALLAAPATRPAPDDVVDVVASAAPRRRSGPRHATPVGEHTTLLATAEERARYARQPLHPHGLDAAVDATREALAYRATRRQRIAARLLPPSVVLRWRMGWLNRVTRVSNALSRTREHVAALNPRRLLARSTR